ncbi:MAG: hypothetical protein ACT4PM_14945 [Gemmatimonadales bacterium]
MRDERGGVERLERAELLARLGRRREAIQWLTGLAEHSVYDMAYLPDVLWRRAELLAGLGKRAAAARDYRRFAELWTDCDPELRPFAEAARQRAGTLSPD